MKNIAFKNSLLVMAIALLCSCEKGYEKSFFGTITFNGKVVFSEGLICRPDGS
ncbi:MAG: hypothetical protein OEX02_07850 [Cyclobacteriaceae bacterium]|nr:hypothetical protein [Cyclobacteriaceae bacterium]